MAKKTPRYEVIIKPDYKLEYLWSLIKINPAHWLTDEWHQTIATGSAMSEEDCLSQAKAAKDNIENLENNTKRIEL